MGDLCIEIETIDDTLVEGDEDFQVSIANPGSTTGSDVVTSAPTIVVTTITDNEEVLWSLTGDVAVDEGGTARYTVALGGVLQAGETATVELSLSDIETNSADYANLVAAVNAAVAARGDLAFDGTTLTYTGDGNPMSDLVIDLDAIDDAIIEGPERYQISLANSGSTTGSASSINLAANLVTTTISDTVGDGGVLEEAVWSLGVDQTVPEGSPGAYLLELAGTLQAGEVVTVDLGLSDIDTISGDYANFDAAGAAAVAAYAGPGGLAWDGTTLTFTSDGNPMAPLSITLGTVDDGFAEGTEDFVIRLSNANSSTGAATSIDATADDAITTIDDTMGAGADDVIFTIVGDTTVDEGGTASYTVSTTGGLGASQTATIEIVITDVDTTSADYANFSAAVSSAVAAYTGPGSVAWDGTTLTYTAAADGDELTGFVIDLDAVDDAFLEGPEIYDVRLANAGSTTGVVAGINAAQNIVATTINDTDGDGGPAEPGGEWSLVGGGLVNEGDPAGFTVVLHGNLQSGEVASVELSLADTTTISADYASFDAAVTAAVADYNGNPTNSGSLAWDGTNLSFTSDGSGPMDPLNISLATIDDALSEGPESFDVSIANPTSTTGLSPSVSLTDNLATTTIIDNDASEFSIVGTPSVLEGATASYTISLSGILQSGETATIDLTPSDIDTTSADYSNFVAAVNAAIAARGDLSFDGTTLTYTGDGNAMSDLLVNLPAGDDLLIEGPEDYTISIANPGSTTGSDIGTSAATSVTTTIIDNDAAAFSLTGVTSVDEGVDATYVLSLAGTLQVGETATIDLGLGDIDTNSSDYSNFVTDINAAIGGRADLSFDGTTLTYTGNGSPMDDLVIDLTAIDDLLIEGPEDYTVSISNPGSTTGGDIGVSAATSVTTTIIDNDVAAWSLTGDPVVGEGSNAKYTLALDGTLQAGETATIDLFIGNVTAIAADFSSLATAVNDAIAAYAGPGSFTFDGTTLTFTSDGNPMGDLCVEIETIDDTLVEGDEDFQVSIANPGTTTGSDVVTNNPTIVVTTITDNDAADWTISGDPAVDEGSIASYTLSFAGTLQAEETATIDLSIGDVDTNSTDYTSFVFAVNSAVSSRPDLSFDGTTLTYTGNGNPMMDLLIDLTAVNDTLTEGPEDYTISIANPGSTSGASIGVGGSTSVTTTILDDDAVAWSIAGDASVGEGNDAEYILSLVGTLQTGETATIELGLADIDTDATDYANFVAAVNAAIAGRSDLSFDGTTLTFTGTGSPMADLVIDLTAIDDLLIEATEDYTVLIFNPGSTTGSDVIAGGTTAVTTSIIDNDTAIWNLTGDATVAEGSTASYSLALNGTLQSGETASIDLGLADVDTTTTDYANFVAAVNAAVAGRTDLVFDGTTLSYTGDGNPFSPLIINLTSTNDGFVEGDEDYAVSISNPASATVGVTVGTDLATTTIVDDDVATWELFGGLSVVEGATAQYNLFLSGTLQSGETATVDLNIADIDTNSTDYANFVAAVNAAIAGRSDLIFDGTTLTYTGDGTPFAALTIDLPTIDDTLTEGVEDYQVSISNPASTTGGTVALGAATSVTTRITDNDEVIWRITGDTSVDEGGNAQYVVQLDGALQAGENSSVLLGVNDIETDSADYENFVAAVQSAIGLRTDFSFDLCRRW